MGSGAGNLHAAARGGAARARNWKVRRATDDKRSPEDDAPRAGPRGPPRASRYPRGPPVPRHGGPPRPAAPAPGRRAHRARVRRHAAGAVVDGPGVLGRRHRDGPGRHGAAAGGGRHRRRHAAPADPGTRRLGPAGTGGRPVGTVAARPSSAVRRGRQADGPGGRRARPPRARREPGTAWPAGRGRWRAGCGTRWRRRSPVPAAGRGCSSASARPAPSRCSPPGPPSWR